MMKPAASERASGPIVAQRADAQRHIPATDREAEREAHRLGHGTRPGAIEQVAALIRSRTIPPEHAWPRSLALRVIKELAVQIRLDPSDQQAAEAFAEQLARSEELEPLLLAPGAASLFERIAPADPSGATRRLAGALARSERQRDDEFDLLVRHGLATAEEAAKARLLSNLQPPLDTTIRTRRLRQRRARVLASREGRSWPEGGGRRPGAKGRRRRRLDDLTLRFLELPDKPREELTTCLRTPSAWLDEHVARWSLGCRRTAQRDWLDVQRALAERGQLGYLTPSRGLYTQGTAPRSSGSGAGSRESGAVSRSDARALATI